MKNIFEKSGGALGGPGSVSFNFENVGLIRVKKNQDTDSQMLTLIDMGVLDVDDSGEDLEVYVSGSDLISIKDEIIESNMEIISTAFIYRAKSKVEVIDEKVLEKLDRLIENLEENEDVQNVYDNVM